MTNTDRPAVIAARDLSKNYGRVQALQPSNFVVADGEFFTLLGPSGCGKTTLLRLIAGFETPSSGELILKGENIATLPPNQRPVNTVFQQYALFPHMTVADNIAFGPKMLSWDADRVQARVLEMLEMIQLAEFAQRLPSQLSGGQQQRVALARAMAAEPALLLLDEPLSALDLKLRQAMRIELKRLQQASGISFIFVTHDQEEALALSDRIAVMSNGVIQQVGTAEEIYERPSNAFVADFIGESNLLDVELEQSGGLCMARLPGDSAAIICAADQQAVAVTRQLSIRPERISITDAGNAHWRGSVVSGVYLGMDSQWQVQLEAGPIVTVRRRGGEALTVGDTVCLRVDDGAARLLNV